MTIDERVNNIARLIAQAEMVSDEAYNLADQAEDELDNIEIPCSDDFPDEWKVRELVRTLEEVESALDSLREAKSPDFTDASRAAAQAREAASAACALVSSIRLEFENLVVALRGSPESALLAELEARVAEERVAFDKLERAVAEHSKVVDLHRKSEEELNAAAHAHAVAQHAVADADAAVKASRALNSSNT
jgi:uncharacterized coiled-coil protein SlyX